jgi:YD repeat-containing protein
VLCTVSHFVDANIADCIGANSDGGIPGQAICTSPIAAPAQGVPPGWFDANKWTYHLCDEAGAHFLREKAWCESAGGTYMGQYANPSCVGAGMPPVFEGGLGGWATEFERRLHNACELNMTDSGWGQTVSSYNCWTGGPKILSNILVTDFRTFSFSGKSPDAQGTCAQPWAELVRAGRWRAITCPADYETRSKLGGAYGEIECWKMPTSCRSMVSSGGDSSNSGKDSVGNPVRLADCSKIQREVDVAAIGNGELQFVRTFASGSYFEPLAGAAEGAWSYWRHTYARRIVSLAGNSAAMAVAQRESGDLRYFSAGGSELFNADGAAAQLQRLVDGSGALTGWRYTTPELEVELYDAAGQLLSITMPGGLVQIIGYSDGSTPASVAPQPGLLISVSDISGRMLRLTYDGLARLSTVTDPAGNVYRYQYDSGGRLWQVNNPDQTQRTYVYENAAFPFLLTGIVDENGTRFATYSYDSGGHAQSTQHAGGAELYKLNVSTSGGTRTVTVTDSRGIVFNNDYNVFGGASKRWRRHCSNCGVTMQEDFTFDANGNRASYVDLNRNRTNYAFDLKRNLEIVRVEGLTSTGATTTATRTVSTQWDPTYRLPSKVAEPSRITTYAYDGAGNLLTKSVQATTDANGSQGFGAATWGIPRVWTYTYGPYRRVATIDGPRTDVSDVTTYTYYADDAACTGCRGEVRTITNALNQVTAYDSYDANGRPTQITDSNGVVTTLAYHPRGWLASRTVNAGQSDAETTTYGYDNVGQLTKVTLPDGSWLGYHYDDAHRITEITDSAGNVVQYALDAMGNRIKEDFYDPQDNLKRTQSLVYDSLNRLQQTIGGVDPAREITRYGYDNIGNLLTTLDALGRSSAQQYDARNRLTQVTDAANGVIGYAYDGVDRLLRVTDPRGLLTQYSYNGLGDLTQLTSPDTGTSQYTYDDFGNLRTKLDGRSQLTTISYDPLNRVTTKVTANGPSVTYTYDQGAFGVGKLSALSDSASVTQWTYDAFGRVGTKIQSLHGRGLSVAYGYARGGKVNRITYPSGRVVTYGYDSAGRLVSVSVDGASLLNGATYEPFGPANG